MNSTFLSFFVIVNCNRRVKAFNQQASEMLRTITVLYVSKLSTSTVVTIVLFLQFLIEVLSSV